MATVRDIEKVLNKPIERRTLECFDYKTPSAEKEINHSPRQMRRSPVRRQGMGRKPQLAMSRSS
jgi:hypothetical protein